MKRVLQINVTAGIGSTGSIAEGIGQEAITRGWESWIAYGREPHATSNSELIHIGAKIDIISHGIKSRIFDGHGLASKRATRTFIDQVEQLDPDVIHLHNIHGYYINYSILFDYLSKSKKPVVWTIHDCWPFTGHCAHYTSINCTKWRNGGCENCPQLHSYPSCYLFDKSRTNFILKKKIFTSLDKLHIVTVGKWLANQVAESFLGKYPIHIINNGLDLNLFKPNQNKEILDKYTIPHNKDIILGVASVWTASKGLKDFVHLRQLLSNECIIVLVGLTKKQINSLPEGIIGVERTDNIMDLITLYSIASVYVNCSLEETLGMTTIEAQACGTPVIVYDSTACSEPVTPKTGIVVAAGDVKAISEKIGIVKALSSADCRKHVEAHFNKNDRYQEYLQLYNSLINE